jgi:hypothetical protein
VPAGPIDAVIGTVGRAVAAAAPQPGPKRFAWHDADAVSELAGAHGARVEVHGGELRITGDSPEAYLDGNMQHHPMSIAGRPVLERAGTYGEVRAQALDILRRENQDPAAFCVFSPYRVIEVHRSD